MEPQAAAQIAKGLATVIENTQEPDYACRLSLGDALAALAAKIETQAAAQIASRGAERFAAPLENPQETDSDHLSSLGRSLAALAAKMEPQAAAQIAKGLAGALQSTPETDSDRLSRLGSALAALAAKMEPQAAVQIASRGAQRFASAGSRRGTEISFLYGRSRADRAQPIGRKVWSEVWWGCVEIRGTGRCFGHQKHRQSGTATAGEGRA
jgi:hypothetical protein